MKSERTLEEVSAASELLPSLWVEKYKLKTESGLPIQLIGNYRFLRDIYDDLSPLQVLLKPPQVGATVMNILKSFYVANKHHKDIIYTLPTQSDVNDMAGGKVNRLVAQNPILKAWVKDHDTVEQKSVGNNLIYYRGTFSNKQAMMVSSDLNIHDEVDASDPSVITQYETRLQAKANGMRWYFSHPTLAGFGVDSFWQKSDKKEWFIICPECKQKQTLEWPRNIDKDLKEYVCYTCNAILSDEVRIRGKWEATDKGSFSGFHISQLMCPWITAKAVLEVRSDGNKDEQYFYNNVLGLPYISSDDKISPDIVLKNVVSKTNSQEGQIIIGVDTGLPIYYTIMNREGVFHYGKCKDPSATYDPYLELEGFLRRWPKSILVSDQGGDLIGIRKLQAKYPGRVYLCYYQKDRKTKELIRWGEKEEYGIVKVDRNRMLQLLIEQLRDTGRFRLNGVVEDWKEWANQFGNIYRILKPVEDSPFGREFEWKRNGPDHYVHAFLYGVVGMDRYAQGMATVVGFDALEGLEVGRIFEE